jgi:hemolysin III
MSWLVFREPVSAWTHAVGFLLTLVGFWLLWQRTRGLPAKRFAFTIFGLTMAVCYLGSTLYHAVRLPPPQIHWFATLDYIGIYLLIAGTVTPVGLIVLQGRWKWGTLGLAWFLAVAGITLRLAYADIPPLLSTGLYVAMGWGVLLCYFELAKALSHRAMRPALLGGILYSVGALFHVLRWPVLHPTYFAAHELFHLLVMAGSLAHFWFMLSVVARYKRPMPQPVPVRSAAAATPRLVLSESGAASGGV